MSKAEVDEFVGMTNKIQDGSQDIKHNYSIDKIILEKGDNFNIIYKILETSTRMDDVNSMMNYFFSKLSETYPEQFDAFINCTSNKQYVTNYNDYYDYADTSMDYDLEESKLCVKNLVFDTNDSNRNEDDDINCTDEDNNTNKLEKSSFNSKSNSDSKSNHNDTSLQINIGQNKGNKDMEEILLNPNKKRFTAYPIEFPHIWSMYKSQQAAFWVTTEIDFSKDYDDFQLLNNDEKHFIKMIIAFFANSDGIVNWNLSERFTKEIQLTEALYAYQWQIMMENIHSEVYSLMLENIVTNQKEKDHMFNAIHTIPSIKEMADWAFKWIESDKSFAHRLVAFAIVEGIFFSGAFASIFWIKTHKGDIMPGLTKSNELIARDEGMHCEFACELYNYINNKLPANEIYEIINDAVVISQTFMRDALPVRLIAMNQDYMDDYIEYIADRLLSMLGYKKLYKKRNPFEFMSKIGLANKENFFEHRNTSYQDSTINNASATGYDFEFDEEFQ